MGFFQKKGGGGGSSDGKIIRLPSSDNLSNLVPFSPNPGDILGCIVNDQYGDITDRAYLYLDYAPDVDTLKGTMLYISSVNTWTIAGDGNHYDNYWEGGAPVVIGNEVTYGFGVFENLTGTNSGIPISDPVNWLHLPIAFDDTNNPKSLIGANAAKYKIIECEVAWNIPGNYISYLKDKNENVFLTAKSLIVSLSAYPFILFPLDDDPLGARNNLFQDSLLVCSYEISPINNKIILCSSTDAPRISLTNNTIINCKFDGSNVDYLLSHSHLNGVNCDQTVNSSILEFQETFMAGNSVTNNTGALWRIITCRMTDCQLSDNGIAGFVYTTMELDTCMIQGRGTDFSRGVMRTTDITISAVSIAGGWIDNRFYDAEIIADDAQLSNSFIERSTVTLDELPGAKVLSDSRIVDSAITFKKLGGTNGFIFEDAGEIILSPAITTDIIPGRRYSYGLSNFKADLDLDIASHPAWNIGTTYEFGEFAVDGGNIYVYINVVDTFGNLTSDILYWHQVYTPATNRLDVSHATTFGHIGWFRLSAPVGNLDAIVFASEKLDSIKVQNNSANVLTVRAGIGGGNIALNGGGTLALAEGNFIVFAYEGGSAIEHYHFL